MLEAMLYTLGGALVIFLIILFGFMIIFDDSVIIILLLFRKQYLRYHGTCIYIKDDQEILVVGSLHGFHRKVKNYGLHHLKAILNNYNPDLLLLEGRQEQYDQGNIIDGPIEMGYLMLEGLDKNFLVKGIDYYTRDSKPGSTTNDRDDEMIKRMINSSAGSRKVLAVVGASHEVIFRKKMKKLGFTRVKITKERNDKLFLTEENDFYLTTKYPEYLDIKLAAAEKETEIISDKYKERNQRYLADIRKFKNSEYLKSKIK